ncbi:MAG: WW domain-containing oxidoreductase [Myxococcota bacterium]|jgi:WW domain-containing oxidoreductase
MSKKFGFESTAEDVTAGVDLTGKTYLITGCNSGLGYETARVLAMRGARIIGAARTEAKAADALAKLGIDGRPVACELSDLASVRAAVTTLAGETLNGIIANAGIMALQTLEQVHGYERQFFTNHVGHFVLVTGLVDALTKDGRVVMLSSGAHRFAKLGMEFDNLSGESDYDAWRMYGRSKLANILFARALAKRFEGSARTANSVHPGVIETNLGRHVPDRDAMYDRMRPSIKTTAQGAATQCFVAVHPDTLRISGTYFSDCAPAKTIDAAKDDVLMTELWEQTETIAAAH